MRAIFLGGILALTTAGSQCQVLCPPQIEWQQSYGTTDYDNLAVAKPSAAGGYLLAGTRNVPPWGNQFYVSRIDLAGVLLWETNYGGSFSDTLTVAEETADGGLVLAGYSNSRAGNNKSAPNYGALDYWVVRLDAAGNKLWDRSYGGEAWDELYAVVETPDGGFLLGGYSSSLPGSGTKTSANYGFYDYWVVRVDMHGRELWQQSFGGSDSDYLLAMTGTTNGFLLTGGSASAVGPIKTAPNHGAYDFWAVRIDDNGHKVWDRSYGGDNSDFSRAVIAQSDGGFMLGGGSRSGVSGTKTARNFSGDDFWIVRINSEGSNIWDQSYGGLSEDTLGALAELPGGGFVLAGLSYSSPSGTKTSPNRGEIDYWVVRLGPSGQQLWDQSFGGLQGQNAKAVGGTPDGGFFVAGTSWSEPGGNKTSPNFGFSDFWFLKLRPETPGDCDGDGVPDERDLCPATPAGGLVDARGCTLEQSCPCEAPWRNSSEYVNCVRHVTADFVRAGLLTPEQREILLTQARLTNCPPPVPPPDTVIAFGFTNVALGGATLSSSSPDFEVSSSSSSYGWSVFASDLDFDGTRGMAVLLGEADSGMFFYPDAPVEWGNFDPSNFMLGKAFGRMNGTDNLLIGAMQARKTYYEVYPVEIDLSPLAPTSLTIQVFLKGVLQSELQVTGATTRIVVHASVTVGPRGNPFWRMPDGSVGAVVDLTAFELPTEWDSVAIGLPGVEDHVIGDRIFIRANNPAYEVDFVSRFEVYGGGGLPSFSMVDGQIGMFKLPHRISGYAVFGAAGGSLTIENVRPEMPDHGTIVELPETRLFDLSLAPVTLTSNEYFSASFNLAGEGIGSGGPYVYPHNVSASLEHRGPRVDLRFAGSLNATSVLVKVYKHGSLVGQTLAPLPVVGSFAAKGNGSGPPLAGFTAAAGNSNAPISLTLSLDRLQTFTAANGSEFRGNLIRLEPQSADKLFSINGAGIFTTHSSFTIRDEQIALVSPRLSIAETESDATITWPLQNHPFALEAASSLDGPFSAVTNEPVELEGTVSLPLPFEPTATRFFRLRLNEQ